MKFPIDQYSTVGKRIDGSIAFTSKNLRGLLRYSEKARVVRVVYWRDEDNEWNGRLRVIYADGVVCEAFFASFLYMANTWMRKMRIFKQAEWVMK